MADDNNPSFSEKDLAYGSLIVVNSLVRLLEKKGIVQREEVTAEIELMKQDLERHKDMN